jgi:hypothetical protein
LPASQPGAGPPAFHADPPCGGRFWVPCPGQWKGRIRASLGRSAGAKVLAARRAGGDALPQGGPSGRCGAVGLPFSTKVALRRPAIAPEVDHAIRNLDGGHSGGRFGFSRGPRLGWCSSRRRPTSVCASLSESGMAFFFFHQAARSFSAIRVTSILPEARDQGCNLSLR